MFKKIIMTIVIGVVLAISFTFLKDGFSIALCSYQGMNTSAGLKKCLARLSLSQQAEDLALPIWESLAFMYKDQSATLYLYRNYPGNKKYAENYENCFNAKLYWCSLDHLASDKLDSDFLSYFLDTPQLDMLVLYQVRQAVYSNLDSICKNNVLFNKIMHHKQLLYYLRANRSSIIKKQPEECFNQIYLKSSLYPTLVGDDSLYNFKLDRGDTEEPAAPSYLQNKYVATKSWVTHQIEEFEDFSYFSRNQISSKNKIDLVSNTDLVKLAALNEDPLSSEALTIVGHGSKYSLTSLEAWQIGLAISKLDYTKERVRKKLPLIIDLSACYVGKDLNNGFAKNLSRILHHQDTIGGLDVYVIGADAPLWTIFSYNIPRPYQTLKIGTFEIPNWLQPGSLNIFKNGYLVKKTESENQLLKELNLLNGSH